MVTSSPNLRMDGGIRCWGVCLTSALIQMITIGVSNCFGVIKQVNDNKSGKMCNGSLQNKPWHAVSCQFQLKVEKCYSECREFSYIALHPVRHHPLGTSRNVFAWFESFLRDKLYL